MSHYMREVSCRLSVYMKNKKYKAEYFEWYDAHTDNGWVSPKKIKLALCYTIGWVVKENKDQITVSTTYCKDEVLNVVAVPKKWLIKRKKI